MTLAEILAPYGVTDEEYVAELAEVLASGSFPSATALSASEGDVLERHGGLTAPLQEAGGARRLWLRNVSSNLAEELRSSLTVDEAAARQAVPKLLLRA